MNYILAKSIALSRPLNYRSPATTSRQGGRHHNLVLHASFPFLSFYPTLATDVPPPRPTQLGFNMRVVGFEVKSASGSLFANFLFLIDSLAVLGVSGLPHLSWGQRRKKRNFKQKVFSFTFFTFSQLSTCKNSSNFSLSLAVSSTIFFEIFISMISY